MNWRERITVNPQVMVGKPVIKGTRITVELIIDLMAGGWSIPTILEEYPHITEEDVHACLSYAAAVLKSERILPLGI